MNYLKGPLLTEGKTKIIHLVEGDNSLVVVESKSDITKNDDPSQTKQFERKAVYATITTCRVFELLRRAGIPVAFEEQISDTEFLAANCAMIPLEVIARRYAVGSYLNRNPQYVRDSKEPPYRFHNLAIEFFLKTTSGKLITITGETVDLKLQQSKGEEDPFILNPNHQVWDLYHPKKPNWDPEASLGKQISMVKVLGDLTKVNIKEIQEMVRNVFLVLEGAWNTLDYRFIDLKIELGINTRTKTLVVADVVDNDSWRLRDRNWNELSKEAFRRGEDLDTVEKKYGFVASLVEQFQTPKQALVLWVGSPSDEHPVVPSAQLFNSGVTIEEVTLSGHKQTALCLKRLEELMTKYPAGGVIVAKVGRSNGLGPTLSTHTIWPVLSIPADFSEQPNNIFSHVAMPSNAPNCVAWPEKNTVQAALNILSKRDPLLYMRLQREIEQLDIY